MCVYARNSWVEGPLRSLAVVVRSRAGCQPLSAVFIACVYLRSKSMSEKAQQYQISHLAQIVLVHRLEVTIKTATDRTLV